MKGIVGWLLLVGGAALAYGCGGACGDAQSLCEECDINPDSCANLFDGADDQFCEDAVAAYEASCAN